MPIALISARLKVKLLVVEPAAGRQRDAFAGVEGNSPHIVRGVGFQARAEAGQGMVANANELLPARWNERPTTASIVAPFPKSP